MRTILTTLLLLAMAPAFAAEGLTRDQVERFADALETIIADSEQYERLQQGQQQAIAQRYLDTIERHGFTAESWGQVGQRVFQGLAALAMEEQDVDGQMAAAREEIRNNPDLSAQQKQQMLQALDQQQQAIGQYGNEAYAGAVAPYQQRLMQIMSVE